MVYKRYSSPFEEPKPAKEATQNVTPIPQEPPKMPIEEKTAPPAAQKRQGGAASAFSEDLAYDDIILVGLIIILLAENKESRDIPLILTLGFLFLIQYIDAE